MQNSSPKKALLGELESIVDILDDSQGTESSANDTFSHDFLGDELFSESFEKALDDELGDPLLDIPLLNDVVQDEHQESTTELGNSELLDLDRIFNDDLIDDNGISEQTLNATTADELTPLSAATTGKNTAVNSQAPVFSRLNDSDEEQSEMFPVMDDTPTADTAETCSPPRPSNHRVDLDLIIQELVDDFIPTLEMQLRNQLTELAPEVIHELAKKHLNN